MVSGLAPGRPAFTLTTGKSTSGSEATGKTVYAMEPAISSARLRSDVATGRLMKGAERCIAGSSVGAYSLRLVFGVKLARFHAVSQLVEVEVNDRRSEERKHLREDQPANYGDSERDAQLGTYAAAERKRQTAQKRGHRGHDDGAKTQQ